jgi:hypothetical protein
VVLLFVGSCVRVIVVGKLRTFVGRGTILRAHCAVRVVLCVLIYLHGGQCTGVLLVQV